VLNDQLGVRCHALRVRLTEPVCPETIAARLGTMSPSRLWVDEVPAAASDPAAEHRRTIELARPAADVRCVLLRYTDGLADLVIVALRDRSVRHLAAALTGAAGPAHRNDPITPTSVKEHVATPASGDVAASARDVAASAWDMAASAWDMAASARDAAASAQDVTAPSSNQGAPEWGLGDGRSTASATHHVALPHDVDANETAWRQALAATVRLYDGQDGTADSGPSIGLLFDAEPGLDAERGLAGFDAETGLAGAEYVPCLAPVFPLTISVGHQPTGGLRLRCDFRLSHFAPVIVAQFARHLVLMYRQSQHAPLLSGELPPGELPPDKLPDDEQAEIAQLGRPSSTLVSTPACLHEAFSRVAAASPEAIALCDRDVRLTYRQLDQRSNRMANGLRALGVGDGDRVGICLERCADLVATLLGVLKAGASYVPIDPAYPAERLTYTAQDAQLRVVVTQLPDFPSGDGLRPVTPDALSTNTEPTPPTSTVTPDDPAYVIYTSGSTGRPKGVVVPHRNVISLMDATREEYRLGANDVWTLFHSSAFDFSVWEIWGCLLTGGRLVIVPYSDSREPERFHSLMAAEGVTVLNQTPSAFAQLLTVEHADLNVRLVIFGGEPLDARMLLPWLDRYPACRMVNMFGITETTVHVTAQTLTRQHALAASRSVGPALPGWHLYVMDPAGRPVPPGVVGEIYVGGAGVALGYLDQPDLTATRFLPDPYTGGRMYRSGDRGRLLPNGTLEHLGRIDSQVKMRGFRIELDEIRAVLLEDPDVRAAAVVVHRDDPHDAATARIDAYVVLAGDSGGTGNAAGDTSNVRKHAAGILPEYMVPATVTALSALPLTTNGKLDASRLPKPAVFDRATPEHAPTDNGELAGTLKKIWSDVLGVPVGLDDDFFELGGNSLFAVRIGAAMRVNALPPIRLKELFRNPTIRGVVSVLSTGSG
jgi:amino acid adenylation domain-containing protein